MRFRSNINGEMSNASLIYRESEYSIDMDPPSIDAAFSLVINELNIDISHEGAVLGLWGFSPDVSWVDAIIDRPKMNRGKLVLVGDLPEFGVSHRIDAGVYRDVYFDHQSGWLKLCLEPAEFQPVEILHGAAIALGADGCLAEVWMAPRFVT